MCPDLSTSGLHAHTDSMEATTPGPWLSVTFFFSPQPLASGGWRRDNSDLCSLAVGYALLPAALAGEEHCIYDGRCVHLIFLVSPHCSLWVACCCVGFMGEKLWKLPELCSLALPRASATGHDMRVMNCLIVQGRQVTQLMVRPGTHQAQHAPPPEVQLRLPLQEK